MSKTGQFQLTNMQRGLLRALKSRLLDSSSSISLAELESKANALAGLLYPDLTELDVMTVVDELTRQEIVTVSDGASVYDPATFKPWLQERKESAELVRWDAYRQLLVERDWERRVIEGLDEQTDEIVDLLGDPTADGDWARRGLLLGEVQSGKTATYIGVLNKAIDLGYRLIIVIAGHTNDLRRQTQSRIDSDLIGYDTARLGENIAPTALQPIGIAKYTEYAPIKANSLTTVERDFDRAKLASGMNWIQDTFPTVAVIKKNAKVIDNLSSYILQQAQGGKLDMPLVLIDDEADWGTPNTGSDTDPTRVNAAIRRLLDTSKRSSYLGITATPFANVFMDHRATHDDLGADLFPSDYIRTTSSPSNYVGISRYFLDDQYAISTDVDDCISILPLRHKRTHVVGKLPPSLETAVIQFFLGTAVRRLRRGAPEAASMLINVSRFTDVQAQIRDLVDDFKLEVCQVIVSELARGLIGGRSILAERIEAVWVEDIAPDASEYAWSDLTPVLVDVAEAIKVELVNARTTTERSRMRRTMTPAQRAHEDLRPTIFIGGDVLARGLTLDGLQVSYFVREPRTVDTQMQMGRWFGYREGYEDIVRIWMPEDTRNDFEYSAEIALEFRELVLEMRAKMLTPRDFGLKVQSHPGGLEIVAANKKKRAEYVEGEILVHGNKFESHYLDFEPVARAANIDAAKKLVNEVSRKFPTETSSSGYVAWRGVPLALIEEFFAKFRGAKEEQFFGIPDGRTVPQIAQYLSDAVGGEAWDVVVVNGSQDPAVELATGVKVRTTLRNQMRFRDGNSVELDRRRVGTGHNLLGALSPMDRAKLKTQLSDLRAPSEKDVLRAMERPLLMLYVVTTCADPKTGKQPEVWVPAEDPLIAVLLGFPALETTEEVSRLRAKKTQRFLVNTVWLQSARGFMNDGDDVEVEVSE